MSYFNIANKIVSIVAEREGSSERMLQGIRRLISDLQSCHDRTSLRRSMNNFLESNNLPLFHEWYTMEVSYTGSYRPHVFNQTPELESFKLRFKNALEANESPEHVVSRKIL